MRAGNTVMKTHKSLLSLVALVALSLSVVACGDSEEAATPQGPTIKKKKKKEEKVPEASDKAAERLAYTYDAVNRRDPFKTYFDELVLEEREQENLTELQRFELDKLKLVAVVVGTATPMAMVQDPSGKGHTVKIGTLVGKRFGQVKHIRRGEIVVQEEFRDFTGKRIPVLKPLKLEKDVGKKSRRRRR
jgi:type IV pilus assembly protein PilP